MPLGNREGGQGDKSREPGNLPRVSSSSCRGGAGERESAERRQAFGVRKSAMDEAIASEWNADRALRSYSTLSTRTAVIPGEHGGVSLRAREGDPGGDCGTVLKFKTRYIS